MVTSMWATPLFASFFIFSCAATELKSDEPMMLVKVKFDKPKSREKFESLTESLAENCIMDVWRESKHSAMVAVNAKAKQVLEKSFEVKVVKDDVVKDIQSTLQQNSNKKRMMKRKRVEGDAITQFFASYPEIEHWARRLHSREPFAFLKNIGKTFEGRDMLLVKISLPSMSKKKEKMSAFIMSGIHAREWLGVASNINFINKLLVGANRRDKRILNLLSKFDFYVLPVANPDGYSLTFKHEKNRLWRKTMHRFKNTKCIGVDPNRNFDVEFGVSGVSSNHCSEIYNGEKPFSENCTANIAKFAKTLQNFKLFFDLHSYSQLFFVPYGYTNKTVPKDNAEMRRVANLSMTAMQKVNNRTYYLGSPAEILYPASGSTIDYMNKKLGVTYSFAIETFPSYEAKTGFLVNTADIAPSANEVTEAILVAAENVRK